MPDQSEKEHRKALRDQLRAAEKSKAESLLPAAKETLLELFDWVDGQLENGCDHTLRHTTEFVRANGMDEQATIEWLQQYGGYCDCEAVMNVTDGCPAFR